MGLLQDFRQPGQASLFQLFFRVYFCRGSTIHIKDNCDRCVPLFSTMYCIRRPSLLGWRPSFLGWRPSSLCWRPSLLGWSNELALFLVSKFQGMLVPSLTRSIRHRAAELFISPAMTHRNQTYLENSRIMFVTIVQHPCSSMQKHQPDW